MLQLLSFLAPGSVRNVTVKLNGSSTAVLSWQQPDKPNGILTQYQVFYTGYNGTQVHCFVIYPLFNVKCSLIPTVISCSRSTYFSLRVHCYSHVT